MFVNITNHVSIVLLFRPSPKMKNRVKIPKFEGLGHFLKILGDILNFLIDSKARAAS